MELLARVKQSLERGDFVDVDAFSDEEQQAIRSFNLITTKPVFYVANVDEAGLAHLPVHAVEQLAGRKGRRAAYICGKLEEELSQMAEDEKASFMELYGMGESGIERIIRVGYEVLGLITFYTVVNQVMRAWTVRKGTTAARAAGKIHSDMERGLSGRRSSPMKIL
jgi:ribosome-binding ATPase